MSSLRSNGTCFFSSNLEVKPLLYTSAQDTIIRLSSTHSCCSMGEVIELEFMRKQDSSWHPCQVSLSSEICTSFGLVVDFESQESEEVIVTKEEAVERLRIRSTAIQGDECVHIKEGEHILAGQEMEWGIRFFDAEVAKVNRVRHSKRNQCRCTFEIKWLYSHPGAGPVTVPTSSVMKLATNSVKSHPVVGEFLNSVKTYNSSDISSCVSFFEETIFDCDLEKQIEEISRLADVSMEGPGNCPVRLKKVDLTGQVSHRTIASQVSSPHHQGPPDRNNSRRTTRSQIKLQTKSEQIEPPPRSVAEESDKTYLTPLGARAALASLMYKLPQEPEFSAYGVENVGFTNAVWSNAVNHTTKTSLDTDTYMDIDVCVQEKVLTNNGPLSSKKLKSPTRATRITRSSIQKGIGHSNDEVDMISSSEKMELYDPSYTKRFTRSTIQKDTRNVTLEVDMGTRGKQLSEETDSRLTPQTTQKGIGQSDGRIGRKSTEESKLLNPTHTPRFTRSTIRKESKHVAVEDTKGQQEFKLSQDTSWASIREDIVTPQTKGSRRKKTLFSPSDAEINASLTQGSKKKHRMSDDIKVTKGEILDAGDCPQGERKSDLSKTKAEPRFSPRLRFLPRTHSQKNTA